PLSSVGSSGVWHALARDARAGSQYKFRIRGADGVWRDKADPMAFHTQVPPETASVVFESTHQWGDDEWMSSRAQRRQVEEPMSVYEVHLGSWRRHPDGTSYTWEEMADSLVPYVA